MLLDLLHFGDGPQAVHYFVLCLVSILGVLQIVAVRYCRSDLYWFDGNIGYWLGIFLIVSSLAWFFVIDEEIFIPGLAGGELFTIFVVVFLIDVVITRVIAFAIARIRSTVIAPKETSEKEPTL